MKTPFYTAFLGFVIYQNGLSNFVLLPDGVTVGSRIYMGSFINSQNIKSFNMAGSSLPLSYINLFSLVSNVELSSFKGGLLSRAAGTSLILTSKLNDKVLLKSKSG
jgi:ribosomal protein L2